MNNLMSGVVLLALLAGIYFLVRAIISAVKKEPAGVHAKRTLIALAVMIVGSVGVSMTQTPEQKAAIEAKREAKAQEEVEKKVAEEKAEKERAEKIRQEAEAKKVAENQKQYDSMIQEITTGWDLSETDAAEGKTNMLKASTLVVKYPNYVHEAPANWLDAPAAMKKVWDYYGQVVNMNGRIYAIRQVPPGHAVAKFFGGDCYEAMLDVGDGIAVTLLLVGDSGSVAENSYINVKGYVCGYSSLVNGYGGESKGLAFVGFAE